jgi:hypothetical protein
MMTDTARKSNSGKRLVYKIVCPNCWHRFFPEESLFVAKHTDLVGDSVLGTSEYQRFLPDHFTVEGEALDPRGMRTTDMACPRCHLQFPSSMLEVQPLFISLIGSPASGKSYFLTTMTWQLRQFLPQAMLRFEDSDPVANAHIHDYERSLFSNPNPNRPTEIRKTQPDDPSLHRMVHLDGVDFRFPLPIQFALWPTSEHPNYERASQVGRMLVLYDNAGEDFRPSVESAQSSVVQHLARSKVLFAMFDPTQDPRFRSAIDSDDPQLTHGLRPDGRQQDVLDRQELVLRNAGLQIRRYLGLSQEERLKRVLIVIVAKGDVWKDLASVPLDDEPYTEGGPGKPVQLKSDVVEQTSGQIRELLQRLCPDFVACAEGICEVVRYVPVSSLGRSPELVKQGDKRFYGIRPEDINPQWVTVPLTYCLCRHAHGLIGDAGGGSKEAL